MEYFKTFAPVAKMTSFRLLLALSDMNKWDICQLDVKNAFLHGTLDEDMYIAFPPGYSVPDHIQAQFPGQKLVYHLLKSLYGIKRAPRQWFIALSTAFPSFGFQQSTGDLSLFVFSHDDILIYLLIYMDDMVLIGNSTSVMAHITEFISTHFKIKALGALHYFLGIQVYRDTTDCILISKNTLPILLLIFSPALLNLHWIL